jgi:acyl-CoA synthetase (AMP-forming)/AMP-acid ligase II
MMVGAAIVCMERFEAGAALDLMEREGATRAIGWPGVINPLLDHPSLPQRSIRAFDDPVWHPSVGAMTGLGMSETASNHTIVLIEDRGLMGKDGFVGRPIPHIEHRIIDEDSGDVLPDGATGTIQLRGYSLMAGFYKREREDTFTPDGFYDTQDRGFFRDGFLHFQGRDVGLIKTAGNNVSALEVEGAIKAMPGVANAFVVGLPDDRIGQIVSAAIVAKPGDLVDLDAVTAQLKADLSSYKVPKVIRLLRAEEVPFMPNGKLDFRALVERIARE